VLAALGPRVRGDDEGGRVRATVPRGWVLRRSRFVLGASGGPAPERESGFAAKRYSSAPPRLCVSLFLSPARFSRPRADQGWLAISIVSEAEQFGGRGVISAGARLGASGVWETGSRHRVLPSAGA